MFAALCLLACLPGRMPAQEAGAQVEVRRVALCRGKRGKNLYGMRFDVPKGLKSKKVTDVDYVLFYVYPEGNEKEHLELWHGTLVGGAHPSQELMNASVEVKERKWACAENGGLDFSGRTRDGKRWRRVSYFLGFAAYENVPEETARRLDEVIDGMCCDDEYFKELTGRK
ncbi:MAG: hypothetical protein ACJ754_22330 [Pyrinomonadaceae bacterium]